MKRKVILLAFLTFISIAVFSQTQAEKYQYEIINAKDTQVLKMIRYYIKNDITKVYSLFSDYKKYIKPLNEIKSLAKSLNFGMRPNYLKIMQTDKTVIFLAVNTPKRDIIGYLITFSSDKMDSKIESIKREKKYDKKADTEIIIGEDDVIK